MGSYSAEYGLSKLTSKCEWPGRGCLTFTVLQASCTDGLLRAGAVILSEYHHPRERRENAHRSASRCETREWGWAQLPPARPRTADDVHPATVDAGAASLRVSLATWS